MAELSQYQEYIEALDLLDEESRFEYIIDIGKRADKVPFPPDSMDDAHIMRPALIYASALKLPIINHCEVPELALDGVMHEGWVSNRLGLIGIPNSTEDSMVARDISLAEETGGRIHIAHASTAGTVDLIAGAKERGVNISCEVTPHHLTLNDSAVLGKCQTLDPLLPSSYDT